MYVAGLLLGVLQIGDWSIITVLSKFFNPLISLNVQKFLFALFNSFAK
ncbi:MAG: hypothetical protein LBD88_01120 [Candidatus Peribacteria bacterium]|nr:hypothetical protein [Candidatus Peribacteria bacterium]